MSAESNLVGGTWVVHTFRIWFWIDNLTLILLVWVTTLLNCCMRNGILNRHELVNVTCLVTRCSQRFWNDVSSCDCKQRVPVGKQLLCHSFLHTLYAYFGFFYHGQSYYSMKNIFILHFVPIIQFVHQGFVVIQERVYFLKAYKWFCFHFRGNFFTRYTVFSGLPTEALKCLFPVDIVNNCLIISVKGDIFRLKNYRWFSCLVI